MLKIVAVIVVCLEIEKLNRFRNLQHLGPRHESWQDRYSQLKRQSRCLTPFLFSPTGFYPLSIIFQLSQKFPKKPKSIFHESGQVREQTEPRLGKFPLARHRPNTRTLTQTHSPLPSCHAIVSFHLIYRRINFTRSLRVSRFGPRDSLAVPALDSFESVSFHRCPHIASHRTEQDK